MEIEHFQTLYTKNPDPWNVEGSWYEQRKRSILLACLPKALYKQAYEPACGNGELTAALLPRCDRVIATDGAQSAVQLAQEKLQPEIAAGHVVVLQQHIPYDWPAGAIALFDLVLISEFAYYLDSAALATLAKSCINCLTQGGTLALCHCKHLFDDRLQETKDVHAAFDLPEYVTSVLHHDEKDFVIDVWIKTGFPSNSVQ